MQVRMKNPALALAGAMPALMALNGAIEAGGVPAKTLGLVHLRASQINGCSVCVDMHARMASKLDETPARLLAVSAWRDTPYFTDDERAALALTEAVTRIGDREDPVPDDVWAEAAARFDEPALGALLMSIAMVNVWNRLNVATRQQAGAQSW